MKILVAEDDAEKRKRVCEALLALKEISAGDIEAVGDIASAKRRLRDGFYDLLVLDMVMPETPDQDVSLLAGGRLVQELGTRPRFYHMPGYIVCLTAFGEHLEQFQGQVNGQWVVLDYDVASRVWIEALQDKARYLLLLETDVGKRRNYDKYLCILTAVDVEMAAVLKLPWRWVEEFDPDLGIAFFYGSVSTPQGDKAVVAAQAPQMGMAAAAVLCATMISKFRPRNIGAIGIAAGLSGRCELGDVLVIQSSWDYGSGKWSTSGKRARAVFEQDPRQIEMDVFILNRAMTLRRDPKCLSKAHAKWVGPPLRGTPPRLKTGPVASGAAVLASKKMVELVKVQQRKLLGIDMEAYGMFYAALHSGNPRPRAFALKAVTDFADETKSDAFQDYAAYMAAQALAIMAPLLT